MDKNIISGRPRWHADDSDPQLSEQLREALADIDDPEIGLNVIQLGLVRDVIIEPEKAHLQMILTTPFCPYGPAFLERTRAKAEESLQRTTTIAYGSEVWDFSMMEEGLGGDWGLY
jgi:metal-sulfur cluster biosynthetic enzyme